MQNSIIRHVLPVPPIRFVLVHYHIFKNAGTTIEYILHRAFGDRFCTIDGPLEDSVLIGSDLASFLAANPKIAAVSSHHLKYPVPEIPGTAILDCCLVRDPLQRVWSMYKYLQRVGGDDELSTIAKSGGLRRFVELLTHEHPQIVNDVQVNLFANGGVYVRPPKPVDLARAKEVLDRIAVLGVVDLFDKSLVAAEYYLRPVYPVEFQYVKQNVSDSDGDTSVSPEHRFRELVGDKLHQEILNLNRLDTELLESAKQEVLRRFHSVPNCEERLADFQRRCELLRVAHQRENQRFFTAPPV